MELYEYKKEICEMADMIKRLMHMDVIIVDKHLTSLVNTFQYEKPPIDIQVNSVVGKVIVTGRNAIVYDKKDSQECLNCPQYQECEISSIVGIPIKNYGQCIGVAAVLFRQPVKETDQEDSMKGIVETLEDMISILENKIAINKLNAGIQRFPQIVSDLLNCMNEIYVVTNFMGRIQFYNKGFANFFGNGADLKGREVYEVITKYQDTEEQRSQEDLIGEIFVNPLMGRISLSHIEDFQGVDQKKYYLYLFSNMGITKKKINDSKQIVFSQWTQQFFGKSKEMQSAKESAYQAESNELSILIEGKSKERNDKLANRFASKYLAEGREVPEVDCSMEDEQVEKALFGYKNQYGYLEMAKSGAICLYSIQQLSLYLQKKLSTYLIQNQLNGGMGISIRMIATSEENLKELMQKGRFDSDLYYYISRNIITNPLVEAEEDIRFYFQKYMDEYGKRYEKTSIKIKEDVLTYICGLEWKEDMILVKQFAEILVMNMKSSVITKEYVKKIIFQYGFDKLEGMGNSKEKNIRELLLYSEKSKKEIAQELGVSRATLYRWMSKYNL